MESKISALYREFDLRSDCTDSQLRQKYRDLLLRIHPDVNQHDPDNATRRTQALITAYNELKDYREKHSIMPSQGGGKPLEKNGSSDRSKAPGLSINIRIDVFQVPIAQIARTKQQFRTAWEECRHKPWDVKAALRLIMAAYEAGQLDAVEDLINNEQLIDTAIILMDIYPREAAIRLTLVWASRLAHSRKLVSAIQMLEDIESTVANDSALSQEVRDDLRTYHYSIAQAYFAGPLDKPEPGVRITHLLAILELGFEFGYIYKFLAEAYHDLGQDDLARKHLEHAYEIDPQLTGAKTISKALHLLDDEPAKKKSPSVRAKYLLSKPEDVPTCSDVYNWFQARNWDEILTHSNQTNYSPRLWPKVRQVLAQLVTCLGEYRDQRSAGTLRAIIDGEWSIYNRKPACLALAKVGELSALKLIREIASTSPHYDACLAYSEARAQQVTWKGSTSELIAKANCLRRPDLKVGGDSELGTLRWLLEWLVDEQGGTPELNVSLARCCLLMEDWARAIILLQPLVERNGTACKDSTCLELQSHWAAALVMAGKPESAISILRPIYNFMTGQLRGSANHILRLALEAWYEPTGQQQYIWALKALLEDALSKTSLTPLLSALHKLARLGAADMGMWIKHILGTEAPGAQYYDPHDDEPGYWFHYHIPHKIDEPFRQELEQLCRAYQLRILAHLRTVLGSETMMA